MIRRALVVLRDRGTTLGRAAEAGAVRSRRARAASASSTAPPRTCISRAAALKASRSATGCERWTARPSPPSWRSRTSPSTRRPARWSPRRGRSARATRSWCSHGRNRRRPPRRPCAGAGCAHRDERGRSGVRPPPAGTPSSSASPGERARGTLGAPARVGLDRLLPLLGQHRVQLRLRRADGAPGPRPLRHWRAAAQLRPARAQPAGRPLPGAQPADAEGRAHGPALRSGVALRAAVGRLHARAGTRGCPALRGRRLSRRVGCSGCACTEVSRSGPSAAGWPRSRASASTAPGASSGASCASVRAAATRPPASSRRSPSCGKTPRETSAAST